MSENCIKQETISPIPNPTGCHEEGMRVDQIHAQPQKCLAISAGFPNFIQFFSLFSIILLLAQPNVASAQAPKLGDLDSDGVATVRDLSQVISHIRGIRTLSKELVPLADLNADGLVNEDDSALLVDSILGRRELTDAITRIQSSSPSDGETGVAITRESIVEFTDTLDPASVTADAFQVFSGDQRLEARLNLSTDNRRVTMFYTIEGATLPPSSTIRIDINGDVLKDHRGVSVDTDGDGIAGGTGSIKFDTLSLTVIRGTSVCGRVFASELVAGPDGNQTITQPLQNVTVTVDGRETEIFAVTDQNGDFRLEDCPGGEFFVHIDGRNAILPPGTPAGAYYPFVGKAWTSVIGEETNVGEIYLPLIETGALQPVSQSNPTVIRLAPDALAEFPEFSDISITVPAASLRNDDGTPGGMVGLSIVPPDRLPGQLPDALNFPVVITVQTDGATNFDTPAPVCFPNLPDPSTGEPLPPGAKTALWSFNHDTGKFGVVGSMTISADGKLACTDEGVGVPAPGWHAVSPGVSASGGNPTGDQGEEDPNPPKPKHPAPPSPSSDCDQKEDDPYTDPVYYYSGEFYENFTDLRIKGRGMDFVWTRKYRSKTGTSSAQGNNWDFSYNIFLQDLPTPPPPKSIRKRIRVISKSNGGSGSSSASITISSNDPPRRGLALCNGSGRLDYLNELQTGRRWSKPSFLQEVEKLPDDTYTMTFPDRGRWEFHPTGSGSADGKIKASVDRNGNKIQFFYDSQGRLERIQDTLDRDILIGYNPQGFIETVTDFAGRVVRYAYYGDNEEGGNPGDLKSVTSPTVTGTPNSNDFSEGKTTVYTYSKGFVDPRLNHNLLTITDGRRNDPNDSTFGEGPYLINTYAATTDPDDLNYDRVVRQIWGGHTIDLNYTRLAPSDPNRDAIIQTIINDRVGNVIDLIYDDRNRLLRKREYTGRANAIKPTTPTTNRPTGKLRDDDPTFFETAYFWNDDSQKILEVHPRGNATQYVYESDIVANPDLRARGNLRFKIQLESATPLRSIGDEEFTVGFSDPGGPPSVNALVDYYEYDSDFGGCCGSDFVTLHRDPRGNETHHRYDPRGNRRHTTHRISGIVEDFEYNEFGQRISHTHPDNGSNYRRRDVFTYYETGAQRGYLHFHTIDADNLALITGYDYDSVGNVTSTTDPRGNDTRYVVNQLDQTVREISRQVTDDTELFYEKDYFYDANNNLVRTDIQNINGDGMAQANSHFTTLTEYEVLNYPVSVTQEVDESHNIVTEFEYDGNRNRTLTRYGEATNGSQPQNTVSYRYDERNLIFHEVRAKGHAKQSTTQLDYDPNGNLAKTITGIEDTAAPRITQMGYDLFDRLETVTDPMGNITTTGYDSNSNVISILVEGELEDVEGSENNIRLAETIFHHDPMDRRTRIERQFFESATGDPIDDGVALTVIDYTDLSKPRSITNDNEHSTSYLYDTANRLLTTTDAAGNTRTLGYDSNSNVVTVTEVDKSDLGSPDDTFVTTNVYDNLDRPTKTTDNAGNINQFVYDSRDNMVAKIDALRIAPNQPGNRIDYVYDGLNRQTSTIRTLTDDGTGSGATIGTITTGQSWDDSSRLKTQTDDNGNATEYFYDPLDRRERILYADSTEKNITFDVHDNGVTRSDANGNQVVCQFDLNNRRFRCDITPGSGVSDDTTFEDYAYDGLNRLRLARDDDSTVLRKYDSLSNRTFESLNGQELISGYDGVGNMISCTYPGGRQISTEYDELERKKFHSDPMGQIAEIFYFGPGRVERNSFKNGTRSDYGFDSVRRITSTVHSRNNGDDVFDSRTYDWDRMHNKTLHHEAGGTQSNYGYDSAYRLTSSTHSDSGNITYELDGVQNRTSVAGGDDPGNYTLDNTAPEPADSQVNQYTSTPFDQREYDVNGNLTLIAGGGSTKTLTYDYRNRFVAFADSTSGSNSSYAYDPFNRRIGKIDNGNTTLYFYDGWQVCEEQDAANNTEATYVYGRYIDEPLQMQRGGNDYYYHSDDLYNVRVLTDFAGQVAEAYDYSDYGKPVAVSSVRNPYLFTGRRYDSATGLYYYRNRYLVPSVGKFSTTDQLGAWHDTYQLGSANSALASNPTSFLDILGNTSANCGRSEHIKKSQYGQYGYINEANKLLRGQKRASDTNDFMDSINESQHHEKRLNCAMKAGVAAAPLLEGFMGAASGQPISSAAGVASQGGIQSFWDDLFGN